MANQMERFTKENDEDYDPVKLGKPKKLALVLSHSYTKAGLEEQVLQALKGKDRAVAELIVAAMKTPPSTVGSNDEQVEAVSTGPFFDAVLSLTELWDLGECSPCRDSWDDHHGFQTVGRFIPLLEGATLPTALTGVPTVDRQGYSPSDVPILRPEILLGGKDQKEKEDFRNGKMSYSRSDHDSGNCVVNDSPEEIEFLGNDIPYPGRIYNPAVFLMWPKDNRQAVALQSKGGQEVYNAKK